MRGALDHIQTLVSSDTRSCVAFATVHGIMESQRCATLKSAFNEICLTLPDGMPLVWAGRLRKRRGMGRVYGPQFMLEMARLSVAEGYTHFLYGGKAGIANRLRSVLEARFPGIRIVGTCTPPFRPLETGEREALVQHIAGIRPDFFWVGLGTPKQERFMAEFVGRLETRVMLGVGAAFDVHTEVVREAPPWMMAAGLQWLFRITQEPGRLWKRYILNNPLFVMKFIEQLLSEIKKQGR